jgi:hypothetical protein
MQQQDGGQRYCEVGDLLAEAGQDVGQPEPPEVAAGQDGVAGDPTRDEMADDVNENDNPESGLRGCRVVNGGKQQ